jgi:predicted GNAT family acetyltransferase
MSAEVVHDAAEHRFRVTVDGHDVVLDYAVGEDGSVDFHHTFTPPALRGRGLAAEVVAAGLAWAKAEGRTVHASCWYVREHLDKQARRGREQP